jgi:hypothetical protein
MIGASTLVFPWEGRSAQLIPRYYRKEALPSLSEAEPSWYQFGVLGAPDPMDVA